MLQYKVQSKLWEVMNLNFISSLRLNRMYQINNFCFQCKLPKLDIFHIFFSCQISKNMFLKFLPILKAAHNIPLSETEIAFGLEITDSSKQKSEQLRNYIFSIVKFYIFKDRANIFQTNKLKVNKVFNKIRNSCFLFMILNFVISLLNQLENRN